MMRSENDAQINLRSLETLKKSRSQGDSCMITERYTSGEYLNQYPTWHEEDSPHKVRQILKMLKRNNLNAKTYCEVGSGAGEILKLLQQELPEDCHLWGYDISPQAFEISKPKSNARLQFKVKDFLEEENVYFDVILLIDLIEHLEDYYGFLRKIKSKSDYKILHIPIDLYVLRVLLGGYLMRVRKRGGHLHYFNKEIALVILKDTGYEVLDFFYTPCHETPIKNRKAYFIRPLRRFFCRINQDLTTNILGGFSLMVLAK